MEYQRLDRMSFQRFAGLRDTGRIPDRNTLRVFRERLVQAKVEYLIFDEVGEPAEFGKNRTPSIR